MDRYLFNATHESIRILLRCAFGEVGDWNGGVSAGTAHVAGRGEAEAGATESCVPGAAFWGREFFGEGEDREESEEEGGMHGGI